MSRELFVQIARAAQFRSRRLLARSVLLGAACGLPACNGCGADKPYTPFGVASSLPTANPAPGASAELNAAPSGSAGFAARKAELVPGGPTTWQGDGLDLRAPKARVFAQVLYADFDGDQQPDAVAWLVPAPHEKNAPPGELWYFPHGDAPRKLLDLPGFVPSGPDCRLSPALTQTGMRSATLDLTATCTATLIARAPARALLVVAPSLPQPVLLTLRAAPAAPGESLEFSVDSSDQDQDGRDDARLTVSVGALGSSEPASADLAWLDRAAGASRLANEPGSSLLHFLGRLGARARLKHSTYQSEASDNVRRLLSSLCAESGVPRVFDAEGAPLRCGDLTRVVDALASSEVSYALVQGDVLEAFSVGRRDGWYFKPLSNAQRKILDRDLLRAVSKLTLAAPFVAHATPLLPELPHYSPLNFEADGALLVRGANEVTRVAADRATEEPLSADGGVPGWPLELATADGQRITGTSHACDRSELLFNRSDAQQGLLPPLATRLLAARPASCAGNGRGPNVVIAPLSYDAAGLDALVEGAHVGSAPGQKPAPGLPPMGSPRSPDGRWLITPTALGLLVIGDRKELWQTNALSEHADASKFSDCVVASEARAAACVDAGRVVLFARGKASTGIPHL